MKKKLMLFLNFFANVSILCTSTLNSKDMATTIKTSSKNYFNNKRIFFTPSLNDGIYALTIFDLTTTETNSLIQKMTKHFHLSPKQSEPLALAA